MLSRPLRGLAPLRSAFPPLKTAGYYHPSRKAGLQQGRADISFQRTFTQNSIKPDDLSSFPFRAPDILKSKDRRKRLNSDCPVYIPALALKLRLFALDQTSKSPISTKVMLTPPQEVVTFCSTNKPTDLASERNCVRHTVTVDSPVVFGDALCMTCFFGRQEWAAYHLVRHRKSRPSVL